VSWSEAEEARVYAPDHAEAGKGARDECLAAMRQRRRADLQASMRVWLMTSAVTLMLMLEDDVAMIAFMFC
jgi:hypothetical protein